MNCTLHVSPALDGAFVRDVTLAGELGGCPLQSRHCTISMRCTENLSDAGAVVRLWRYCLTENHCRRSKLERVEGGHKRNVAK